MTTVDEHQLTRLRFPGLAAVDVNGETIAAALCGYDGDGKIRLSDEALRVVPTPIYDAAMRARHPTLDRFFEEELVTQLAVVLDSLLSARSQYARLPVGISFSGQVGPDGQIYSASSIFRGARAPLDCPLRLVDRLRQHPGLGRREFVVLNNVSAAAWRLSTIPEVVGDGAIGQFLVVHVGTGFGSKAFNLRGQHVVLDDRGFAGELGHVPVEGLPEMANSIPCDCGRCGHLAAYFLPEGLQALCRELVASHPVTGVEAGRLRRELSVASGGAEFIGRQFMNGDPSGVGDRIVSCLAQILGASLAHIVLAIGVERVVLKGGLFRRWGEPASRVFASRLHRKIQDQLAEYFPVGADFVLPWLGPSGGNATPVGPLADRVLSLEGLAVHLAAQYRSTHRVTAGYFAESPCLTLSSPNDIRYPVIRTRGVFDPGNPILEQLTVHRGQRRKLVVVLDGFYDASTRGKLDAGIREYFRSRGRVVPERAEGSGFTLATVEVVICHLDPAIRDGRGRHRELKTPEQVDQVVRWCRESLLPRGGMLVAVGGGVILDIVGFAAQQYRRMVSYLRIPTTLIGQVDAGVGVKVGVNYGSSKNLIGAFYPPYATVNDPEFLFDLATPQIECGLAEILKMGVVAAPEIVKRLEELAKAAAQSDRVWLTGALLRSDAAILDQLVEISDEAIESMMRELQGNITERELRRLVDFGHTFSPKIEAAWDYRIPHGYAVAIDMYLTTRMASRLPPTHGGPSLVSAELLDRYSSLLKTYRLLNAPLIDGKPVLQDRAQSIFDTSIDEALRHRGGNLNLVVPTREPGRAGFLDLVDSSHDLAKPEYCAVTTRGTLQECFREAVDSLYRIGTHTEFGDDSNLRD